MNKSLREYKEKSKQQGIYPNIVLDFPMLEDLIETTLKALLGEKEEVEIYMGNQGPEGNPWQEARNDFRDEILKKWSEMK